LVAFRGLSRRAFGVLIARQTLKARKAKET
jgi:hypothetical protein